MNWENRLTILRIILTPVFITMILYQRLNIALLVFIVAAITDGLDGYLARSRKERTRFGTVMDPVADKMLIGSAFICFSLVSELPAYLKMPVYVPVIVISRDVIILLGVVIMYLLAGKVDIKPTVIGKVTTFFQMFTIIVVLLRFIHSNWMWNITVILTAVSGLDYIRIASRQINEKS